jgi:hypothetical protein
MRGRLLLLHPRLNFKQTDPIAAKPSSVFVKDDIADSMLNSAQAARK